MQSSVQDITRDISHGDAAAFGCFYDAWFDRMYREARRATGRDEAFCLDVVQDSMMRVIRFMKPLPSEAALYAWIRRTVIRCAIDRIRSEERRTRREIAGAVSPTRSEGVHEERMQWLREELAALDDQTAQLLEMRHRFGWTLQQIASTLGLSIGTVDGRIRRALGTLRDRASEGIDETR